MPQVTPAVTLPCAAVSKIEFEEHNEILESLSTVVTRDLGEVCVRVGMNAAGAMVVLLQGMGEWHGVVSQIV